MDEHNLFIPYHLPTQIGSDFYSGLPGAVEVQTGVGDSGAGTASAMKSCSLVMTGDTFRSAAFGANLLWLFFTAIVIGGLRAVKVRVRRK